MRAGQPVAELARRLRRRGTVKRHQRRGDAGNANDVRAPAILRHRHDFDEVRVSRDGLLIAMNVCGHSAVKSDEYRVTTRQRAPGQ